MNIRQSTGLCVVWIGANELEAGQDGVVAFMCSGIWQYLPISSRS